MTELFGIEPAWKIGYTRPFVTIGRVMLDWNKVEAMAKTDDDKKTVVHLDSLNAKIKRDN